MNPTSYARSAEATALHAVIDGDLGELNRVLADFTPGELILLAKQAEGLGEYCRDAAEERRNV